MDSEIEEESDIGDVEESEDEEEQENKEESEEGIELKVEEQSDIFFEEIPEESFEETVESIENTEDSEALEESNLLPARGTCRRKPLRNCYREEKGVQRNSWRKEKCKWRLS